MNHTHESKRHLVDKVVGHIQKKFPTETAQLATTFAQHYFAQVAPEDLLERNSTDLYGTAISHWNLAHKRQQDEHLLRVYNPHIEEHGWQSTHTIIELVCPDMPFLVDSISMKLNQLGLTVHLIIHPVLHIIRDKQGNISKVTNHQENSESHDEAILHFEIDRQASQEKIEHLETELNKILHDVSCAVEDWQSMRNKLKEIINALKDNPTPLKQNDVDEDLEFLRWLDRHNFTFLGYREYSLSPESEGDILQIVPDSGLGILRNQPSDTISHSFASLPAEIRKIVRKPSLLIITKSNSRSTVHRPTYLDYLGIKRFNENGEVMGEWRFLGLYTSAAYNSRLQDIPLIRRKEKHVLTKAGFRSRGHSAKALVNILETLPRDELFQSTEQELLDMATSILHLQERQRVHLIVRRDTYGRFVSCQVFIPRERFNTKVRLGIQKILTNVFQAKYVDFSVALSESILARIYFIVHTEPGKVTDYDTQEIEAQILDVTRSWEDDLHQSLMTDFGEDQGNHLFSDFRNAFPASYCEDYPAAIASADIKKITSLGDSPSLGMTLYQPLEVPEGFIRFKLFRKQDPLHLSEILPMLENMGVRVIDERPHELKPESETPVWVHDLGIEFNQAYNLDSDHIRALFQDAFHQVWHGSVENDGFNRLVLAAQLSWRDVVILRACYKYLKQTGLTFSQSYVEQALCNHPQIASLLVDLFTVRLSPSLQDVAQSRSTILIDAIENSLEAVPNLDEDRILRTYFIFISSILRTNFFQLDNNGQAKDYVSFKLDPSQIPELPEPRPQYEVFVYSPIMEGIHLRGGKVARGGLRWSDRPEDFRTEIFGLVKTQMVKNAVIVPVGSKGGFVVKKPLNDLDSSDIQKEVKHCYSYLIRGLLDITDNLISGEVSPPKDVVRHDDDDPYLVVAADKGTATFSDTANAIAHEYDFWLGDAFASGGSAGYDHKKMGITAKGAWESTKRHFRELGKNIQEENFTVIGIGSMNGDVFGNGMLLSRHIKLIGAFSHRHIFLDPNPDPELSYQERERLFKLPRSSWFDYDAKLISEGGGVFERSAKAIALTPQVQHALDIKKSNVSPNELLQAMLKAPVDLIWNGGIGTFVKAQDEQHADAGDRSNDAIRINANQLRCKAFGEGGNLGLTADARIEYALNGGLINTDFIDNSGGVDCSDHEVNIKILLQEIISEGDLSEKQRNDLLVHMEPEVSELVLTNNYQQTQILSMEEAKSLDAINEHERFIKSLEKSGHIDRATWNLPTEEEMLARRNTGRGLTRPELSVLLAYSKIDVFEQLLCSGIYDDPFLANEINDYFPKDIIERYASRLPNHRLRKEIIATFVTNNLINRMGFTFPFRTIENTGATAEDLTRAYLASRDAFELPSLWDQIEALDNQIDAKIQLNMLHEIRKLTGRSILWFLRNRKQPIDIESAINDFQSGIKQLHLNIESLLDENELESARTRTQSYIDLNVPGALAQHIAHLPQLFSSLDITEVSSTLERDVLSVGRLYFLLADRLDLNWLRDQIIALPEDSHWPTLARSALREDVYRLHRTLTREALLLSNLSQSPEEILESWLTANAVTVDRYLQHADDFKSCDTSDLAMLSVAINAARKLIQTTGRM